MSFAAEAVRAYFERTGRPGDLGLDPLYQYEMTVLRDTLGRLELILDDEGVDQATAERVSRCMLYGAPSPAAAEERMRREAATIDMLKRTCSPIVHIDGDAIHPDTRKKLGLPPR